MGAPAVLPDAGYPLRRNPGRAGYSPAEREAAFLVWMGAGKQQFTTTSSLTGINRMTLAEWAAADDWSGKAASVSGAAVHPLAIAQAMLPHFLRAASDRWLRILTDDDGHQPTQGRLIELAFGLHGMVVPKHSLTLAASVDVAAPASPLAELVRSAVAASPALAPYLDPPEPGDAPPQGFTSEQAGEGVGVPHPEPTPSRASDDE